MIGEQCTRIPIDIALVHETETGYNQENPDDADVAHPETLRMA